MFGREFSIENTLILWDAIFAFDSEFTLVEHIATSMIYTIKDASLVSFIHILSYGIR